MCASRLVRARTTSMLNRGSVSWRAYSSNQVADLCPEIAECLAETGKLLPWWQAVFFMDNFRRIQVGIINHRQPTSIRPRKTAIPGINKMSIPELSLETGGRSSPERSRLQYSSCRLVPETPSATAGWRSADPSVYSPRSTSLA